MRWEGQASQSNEPLVSLWTNKSSIHISAAINRNSRGCTHATTLDTDPTCQRNIHLINPFAAWPASTTPVVASGQNYKETLLAFVKWWTESNTMVRGSFNIRKTRMTDSQTCAISCCLDSIGESYLQWSNKIFQITCLVAPKSISQ